MKFLFGQALWVNIGIVAVVGLALLMLRESTALLGLAFLRPMESFVGSFDDSPEGGSAEAVADTGEGKIGFVETD